MLVNTISNNLDSPKMVLVDFGFGDTNFCIRLFTKINE